jgi:hypothetical protein
LTRGCYAVLASVSRSYSPLEGRSVTCYSPVRRFTHGLLHFLARLACVRHAASVDSEPGSNSRLKPDVVSPDGGQSRSTVPALTSLATEVQGTLLVRMIKPNLIHSHNWHVQPSCQRSIRALRLSGALWDRGPGFVAWVVLELVRLPSRYSASPAFLSEPSNPIELLALCQTLFIVFFRPVRGRSNMLPTAAPRSTDPNSDDPQAVLNQNRSRSAQIFQTATSTARAARGSRRNLPRVMQWLVLCGITYRGPGVFTSPHLTLRTSFPIPKSGRAHRPPGSSIASIYSLARIAQAIHTCNPCSQLPLAPCCSFLRIATTEL